jgi:hypothetical protein
VREPWREDLGPRPGNPRGRAVLLVLVSPAFLGAAYFLFVEFMFREPQALDDRTRMALRLGGAGLVLISLVLAAACGYLLAERFLRPLRLILRLAESGEIQPDRAHSLWERGREYLDLHRLLHVLVNQNQTGARAMEELDELRAALAHFREEFSRTGLHGIPPEVTVTGPVSEVALHVQSKRNHLLSFFRDLRERVGRVRLELERLGASLDLEGENQEMGESATAAAAAVNASLNRLRQLGTVLALESARAGGAPARRAAELLDRFHVGLGDLESRLETLPPAQRGNGNLRMAESGSAPSVGRAEMRERWRLLLEGIESIERRLEEAEER